MKIKKITLKSNLTIARISLTVRLPFIELSRGFIRLEWHDALFSANYILNSTPTRGIRLWVEYSPKVWKTGVQYQVESYQRLKKCYMVAPCLTLSIKRYRTRVNWSNQGKRITPTHTLQCCSYWKGNLLVTLNYGRQLYSSSTKIAFG